MGKIDKLLSKNISNLKCILYSNSDYLDGIEAELHWDSNKLMLSFLSNQAMKKQPDSQKFYGVSINGEKFVVIKSLFENSNFHGNGIGQLSYLVTELIEGTSDDEAYAECIITFNHFPEWIRLNAYDINHEDNEEYFEAVHLKKIAPIEHSFKIGEETIKIVAGVTISTRGEFFRSYISEQKAYLKVVPENIQTRAWFLDIFLKIKDLFTLLIGEKVSTVGLNFKNSNYIKPLSYYNISYISLEENQKLNYFDVLVPYHYLEESFNTLLTNWFKLISDESMYDTVRLLISNFYLQQFEESIFLNYMQGLEGFHRLKYGGGYLSDKEFRPARKKIEQFINELDLSQELSQSIKDRLRYSHEYSLQTRLVEIFEILEDEISGLLFEDNEVDGFIQNIKQTRNNLTHPNNNSSGNFSNYSNINGKLKIIFMTVLLRELGIEANIIRECLVSNNKYNYLLPYKPSLKFEMPNLDGFKLK